MANAFSRYVGLVAAAGKAEYPIPHYTNVWLNFDDPSVLDLRGVPLGDGTPTVAGGGAKAGVYPSGGAVPHAIDLWKHNAPALDLIAPDLYLHDYEWVCRQYRHEDQPLFIPEQKRDKKGARRVMLAYGTYLALGCSPFGIDTLLAQDSPITRTYRLLSSMGKHILEAQANRPEDMMGFFFDETSETNTERNWVRRFGDFELTIDRAFVFGKARRGRRHRHSPREWEVLVDRMGVPGHFQEHKTIVDFHRNLILGREDGRCCRQFAFGTRHEWRRDPKWGILYHAQRGSRLWRISHRCHNSSEDVHCRMHGL
jgi:hypothetical protein